MLVRVGFVVAAFSGIGAALYVAGWILLPDEPAGPATPRPTRPRAWLVVGLAIAAAITMGTVFGGDGPGVLLPLLVVAGLLYLLHRSRGSRVAQAAGGRADGRHVCGRHRTVAGEGRAPVRPVPRNRR